jgi:LPXTG-motif cell wall-anchored protein
MNFNSRSALRYRRAFWRKFTILPLCFVLLLALGAQVAPASADETEPSTPLTVAEETTTPEVAPEPSIDAPSDDEGDTTDEPNPETETPVQSLEPRKSAPKAGLLAAALPAAVGDETLTVLLTQQTGTPSFDADDAAGHDSSATNDIIRTNDTITYTVSVEFEGSDQTKPTIKFTLPQGQELVSLPPFCLAGSSVTPATLPAPVVPVTATSYQSLPTQEVSCVLEDGSGGSSFDHDFVAKVRPEMPNGTTMDPIVASATSDQVTTPAESAPLTQTVSAAANFDASKRGTATTDTTGPALGFFAPCSFDPSRGCRRTIYPLTINAPADGKGVAPLSSPITLTDDISPDAMYGAGTTTSAAWLAAGAGAMDKYGARITSCGLANFNLRDGTPYSSTAGSNTETNSVRDSGTIDCTQLNVAGEPSQITITGADTTAYTVPSTAQNGSALPADANYVVSFSIIVDVPIDAIHDLGTSVDGVDALTYENEYTDFTAEDVTGLPNTGEILANNLRRVTVRLESSGDFNKQFVGVTGTAGNTTPGDFQPGAGYYEGPPGSSTVHDGNTVVVPGQTVLSTLTGTQTMVAGTGTTFDRTRVMCDTWDDSTLLMPTTFDNAGGGASFLTYLPSGGDPVWIAGWALSNTKQPNTDELPNVTFQYGYTATPGSGAASDCNTGEWYDSIADVPTAVQADGLWTGVNRVRVSYSSFNTADSGLFMVNAAIALRVLDTDDPVGTILPNWAASVLADGQLSMPDALDDGTSSSSSYVPAAHSGALGDRLILGGVTARINKFVRGANEEFTGSAVPQYTSGTAVDYRLNPTLTADVTAGTMAQVFVEDCLPEYQQFVSSTREGSGESITPTIVQAGSPAGAEVTCAANETYVKWDLGQNVVNEPIDPIIYTVEILDTARNGTYTNRVVVSSPGDPSPVGLRDDTAQIQVITPQGIKISKSTPQNIVEINPAVIDTPRTLKWSVDFANVDSPLSVSNVDIVDVLPANGVGTTDFEGALAFTSATVAAGTGINILYTKTASSALDVDAGDASNDVGGSTVWCDAPSGGAIVSGVGTAADCPSSAAEVTGLRFQRPGPFLPADLMTIDIVMTPSNNDGGDVYENQAAGRADGVTLPVGPAKRQIAIIESSVGNYVWEDLDSDGIQDDGEPAVPGFPVKLVGEDLDGNPVSISTTTDADGKYSFTGLASGTYKVIFDPNGLTSNSTFTQQDAGDDDAVDSDGDTTTGETVEFTLAPDSSDPTWDQGLIIDRNVDISVDKRFVSQTELDDDNHATVTYELIVANDGTAEGSYDLADELKFGGDIEIDSVTVSNTDPGDIETDPDFDGVDNATIVEDETIGGGDTHVYEVTVETTVKTTITSAQRDCTLTESEIGTGYLNEAQLTVDNETQTDTACGTPEKPKAPPSGGGHGDSPLPDTGGPELWITLGGMLALALGFMVLARRREEEQVGAHRRIDN